MTAPMRCAGGFTSCSSIPASSFCVGVWRNVARMGLFDWFRRPRRVQFRLRLTSLARRSPARGPARRGSRADQAYREQPAQGRHWAHRRRRRLCWVGASMPGPRRLRAAVTSLWLTARHLQGEFATLLAPGVGLGADRAVCDARLARPDFTPPVPLGGSRLARAGLLREIADHPLLTLLASPNNELTGRKCIQMTPDVARYQGRGLLVCSRRGELGQPIGYFPLPPHWVSRLPTAAKTDVSGRLGTLQ